MLAAGGYGGGREILRRRPSIAASVHIQIEQSGPDCHMLIQRHRSMFFHHDFGVTAHSAQPLSKLFRVADCGRQGRNGDVTRQLDQDLFPHCSAGTIC